MVKKWFFNFLTPIAVAVLIAACGGGGGGGAPPAPTPVGGVATAPHDASLTPEHLDALAAGNLYFNVHSEANPVGEIRGHLGTGANVTVHTAMLDGTQEVPPLVVAGTGKGAVVVDNDTLEISGGFTFTGLTGNATAAHIHLAPPGMDGGVEIGLVLVSDGDGVPFAAIVPGETVLTQAQLTALNAGNLYFNVHTAANPDGEIRGQLVAAGVGITAAVATLTGADEVPPVTTSATGKAALVVDTAGNIIIAAETFDGIINPTVTHIHLGTPDVAGGVIVGLTFGPFQ